MEYPSKDRVTRIRSYATVQRREFVRYTHGAGGINGNLYLYARVCVYVCSCLVFGPGSHDNDLITGITGFQG